MADSTRPMRLVVSSAAGTAPDIIARLISYKLADSFKRAVVVDNKAGANGSIAASEVQRAEPDGLTLLVTPAGTLTANPYLYPEAAASAVTDLSQITQIATVDFVVAVRSTLSVKTLPELLDYLKANPGKVTAATTAHGSFPHLAAEMLKQRSGFDFAIVKNNGGAAAGSAVAGGHADFVIETSAVLEGLIQAGHLRPIASTGRQREAKTPDLPTIAEAGFKDFAISGWIALVAPKATPLEKREAIRAAVTKALADPTVRERLESLHFRPVGSSPEDTEQLVAAERVNLSQLIQKAGLAVR
ncbi:tripartite tricarboxylate transporter substrate binding protein [Bosea sp. (in: a-proteobacteria)]|uniref:Bug family tripartite tricarboxylate transporter substrate binding protein n=1 Tax=Bosea sp. (in: a-proteobacteria) TaxID=1871050 RepID=UPI002B498D72|nr:tripartite tricarboxylate transporter substrate binding protein [Bosea sp. (in: a-proteobacteria)]WRH56763.1 MAG: tripartite tricarboxylate transporter substrate binding protein [Bosea sp. (in: a-proteobacteria)]